MVQYFGRWIPFLLWMKESPLYEGDKVKPSLITVNKINWLYYGNES